MPYIFSLFLVSSGCLLAVLAAGYWRFPDGNSEAARSRARAFGFGLGLVSFVLCASGFAPPFEGKEELDARTYPPYLPLASIAVWLAGLCGGAWIRVGGIGRKYLGLAALALGVMGFATKNGSASAIDLLLLAAITTLTISFLIGESRSRLRNTPNGKD